MSTRTSENAPADWEDVVEATRHDLQVVADDADDEAVSAAIEEVWSIVDAFEERVGKVDVETIAGALDVEADAAKDGGEGLDPASIPDAFVADDPGRAATLARLTALIDLDGATDYEVGRLWEDGRGGESKGEGDAGDDDGSRGGAGDASAGSDDAAEELRSRLVDSVSEFRERVEEARGGLVDSGESGEDSPDETGGPTDGATGSTHGAGSDDGHRSTSSTGPGSSGRSNRSATTFSTLPSNRRDLGRTTGFSTVPGRRGRSGSSSRRTLTSEGDDGDRTEGGSEESDEE